MRDQVSKSGMEKIIILVVILFVSFSCKKRGCMDPDALNTDLEAEIADNSSCNYADFDRAEMLSNVCDNYIFRLIKISVIRTSLLTKQHFIFHQILL